MPPIRLSPDTGKTITPGRSWIRGGLGHLLTGMATLEDKLGAADRGLLLTCDGIAYNCHFANPSQGKNQIVISANLAIAHSDALNNRF